LIHIPNQRFQPSPPQKHPAKFTSITFHSPATRYFHSFIPQSFNHINHIHPSSSFRLFSKNNPNPGGCRRLFTSWSGSFKLHLNITFQFFLLSAVGGVPVGGMG
jgi:hypothetical protein